MRSSCVSSAIALTCAVAALIPACSRELVSLTGREAEPPAPAFLGELAGEYRMLLEADEDVQQAFATADALRFPLLGNVVVMHFVEDGGEDALVGSMNLAVRPEASGFLATLDAEHFAGAVFADAGDEDLVGRRLASGNTIVIDTGLRLCRAGQPRPLYGDRVCEFNAALSGLFDASAGVCGATLEPAGYLGVGVLRDFVLLVRYPTYERFDWGYFDRYLESGFTLAGYTDGRAKGDVLHTWFSLTEQGGTVTLEQQTYATARVPAGTEQALTYDRCVEQLQATRLAGGKATTCAPADSELALYGGTAVAPHPTSPTTLRRIYVAAFDPDEPGAREGMEVLLRRADTGDAVTPVDLASIAPEQLPDNVVAIYDVPAAALEYEVYVLRRDSAGAIAKLGPAQCVKSVVGE